MVSLLQCLESRDGRGRGEATMTEPEDMQRYVARAKMFKALADPKRVQIVDVVTREGTMCGTQLAERLGISLALLSHHWKILV